MLRQWEQGDLDRRLFPCLDCAANSLLFGIAQGETVKDTPHPVAMRTLNGCVISKGGRTYDQSAR